MAAKLPAELVWRDARRKLDDASYRLREATNALIEIEREYATAVARLDDAEEAMSRSPKGEGP